MDGFTGGIVGFGPTEDAEDPFDAFVGLLGMVHSQQRVPFPDAPPGDAVRQCEGWILGLR